MPPEIGGTTDTDNDADTEMLERENTNTSNEDTQSNAADMKALASSVLQKAAKSYLLVFYGKQIGNCCINNNTMPQNAACCVYTDPTFQALNDLFQEMHAMLQSSQEHEDQDDNYNHDDNDDDYDNNASRSTSIQSCVRGIHFVDYTFNELPPIIGQVFTQITQCSFYKCHHLKSFRSTLLQFPSLVTLAARDCPSLTSLSSLSHIPINMALQAIRINNCGLRVSSQNDWEEGMVALGGSRSFGLVLHITSCRYLKRLPRSIIFLKSVLSCLRLEDNLELDYLPEALGGLKALVEFQLIHCPKVYRLPGTMMQLRGDCKVSITGNERLVLKIMNSREMAIARMVCECNCGNDIDIRRGSVGVRSNTTCSTSTSTNTKKCHDCNVQVHRKTMEASSSYYSQKVGKMKAYYRQARIRQFKATVDLSVLLRRARFRAIHRIYRPGGVGFYRCRDNFRMMSMGKGCSGSGGGERDCTYLC